MCHVFRTERDISCQGHGNNIYIKERQTHFTRYNTILDGLINSKWEEITACPSEEYVVISRSYNLRRIVYIFL